MGDVCASQPSKGPIRIGTGKMTREAVASGGPSKPTSGDPIGLGAELGAIALMLFAWTARI